MPARRKKTSFEASDMPLMPKKTSIDPDLKRYFRLLDLPAEVLDLVVSYVIEVPSHPQHGALNADVMTELFSAATTQVNRLLRQRTIDVVSRSVLWLELKCRDRSNIKIVEDLNVALPVVPSAYHNLIPASLQKISIHFGDQRQALRTTRTLKEENTTFLFPFNYHSLSVCSSRLSSSKVKRVTVSVPQLSAAFQKVFEQQIMPLVRLFRYDLDVEVLHENGERKTLPRKSQELGPLEGIARKILEIIDMVRDLDQRGLSLEATLLCMYHGMLLKVLANYDPEIERLELWVHPTGKLGLSDWQTDSSSLFRMKVFRSLHYIEYRACLGYIEGVHAYGWVFARCHYSVLTNPPLIDSGNARWGDSMHDASYGLPDHELAQMHFVKALFFLHIQRHYNRFKSEGLLEAEWTMTREETAREACVWAYYAWSLDRVNINYQKLLIQIEADCGPLVLKAAYETISNFNSALFPHHQEREYFKIHPKVLREWMQASHQAVEYLGRAQEVAKLADVQYDKGKGEIMSPGFTQQSRQAQQALFNVHTELAGSTAQQPRPVSINRHVLRGISDNGNGSNVANRGNREAVNHAAIDDSDDIDDVDDINDNSDDDSGGDSNENDSEDGDGDDDDDDDGDSDEEEWSEEDDPFEHDYLQDFHRIAPWGSSEFGD